MARGAGKDAIIFTGISRPYLGIVRREVGAQKGAPTITKARATNRLGRLAGSRS